MSYIRSAKCPGCGTMINITPEAGKIGVVCPKCKTFIGFKNGKMSEEELEKVAAAIKNMLREGK